MTLDFGAAKSFLSPLGHAVDTPHWPAVAVDARVGRVLLLGPLSSSAVAILPAAPPHQFDVGGLHHASDAGLWLWLPRPGWVGLGVGRHLRAEHLHEALAHSLVDLLRMQKIRAWSWGKRDCVPTMNEPECWQRFGSVRAACPAGFDTLGRSA